MMSFMTGIPNSPFVMCKFSPAGYAAPQLSDPFVARSVIPRIVCGRKSPVKPCKRLSERIYQTEGSTEIFAQSKLEQYVESA